MSVIGQKHSLSADLDLLAPVKPEYARILTPEAMVFLEMLANEFEDRRQQLLHCRQARQAQIDAGITPDFLPETKAVREADWRVAPIPPDLRRRHVEITGPVDRKMIINALNSGADVFMADFEDANAPLWDNLILGQANLYDAVRGAISYETPDGKTYRLNDRVATLMVRPRGWHLDEKHVAIGGEYISASLFDFGLYFFHNARALIERGTGPYFYLPKLESHLEARLWNDVFNWAQDQLNIPRGTIRATVLIETILAAFEMDEILWELRDHSAGLNCGRWDYIFSIIKKFRNRQDMILSERALVTMTVPFMRQYTLLTIQTCHRRGIHALGGMAAQIPIKSNRDANEAALGKVRADKEREVSDGHDGTWVAHPGLVPVARESFNKLAGDHQIDRKRDDVHVAPTDLLTIPQPYTVTEEGVRTNISVAIQYLAAWLGGQGCVPINNLMEDAATAEISRAQLWQWAHHRALLSDGRTVAPELISVLVKEELSRLRDGQRENVAASGRLEAGAELLQELSGSTQFPEFLTSFAYGRL
ncbi:MAG: malate synthase A [Phycisphaerae bacterium]